MKTLVICWAIIAFATSAVASTPIGRVVAEGNSTQRGEVINKLFDELVPLQRARFLDLVGLSPSQIRIETLTEKKVFHDTAIQSLLINDNPFTQERAGGWKPEALVSKMENQFNPIYLPSTYNLDPLMVLESLADLKYKIEKSNERSLLSIIEGISLTLLGDSGRRDIIERMNSLRFEEVRNFVHKVRQAWSLWTQQTALNSEKTEALRTVLDRHVLNIKGVMETRYHPDSRVLPPPRRFVEDWNKIEAMPSSPAKNELISTLFADYTAYDRSEEEIIEASFYAREASRLDMIGASLLRDVRPPAIFAMDWLSSTLMKMMQGDYHKPVKLNADEKTFLRENFLNILDEELQKFIADKE